MQKKQFNRHKSVNINLLLISYTYNLHFYFRFHNMDYGVGLFSRSEYG